MNDASEGYLLIHPHYGIYLGHDGQQHYWSKANPGRLIVAVVFPALGDLVDFLAGWPTITAAEALPIKADIRAGIATYASIEACVHAGAEGWISQGMICYGPIQ